jgi:hypothetical protein
LHARAISRLKQALEGRLLTRPKIAARRPQTRQRLQTRRIAAKAPQMPVRRRLRQVA